MNHSQLLMRFLIGAALVAVLTTVSLAQSDKHDWNNVQKLSTGTTLKVKLKSGEKIEGRIVTISPDTISLSVNKGAANQRQVRKEEISEIRRKSAARTATYCALLGVGGLFLGGAAGYGVGEISSADGPISDYTGMVVGVAAGAVIGAILGSRGVLVYKSF